MAHHIMVPKKKKHQLNISQLIIVFLSLFIETIYLYKLKMLPFINLSGSEGVFFIPLINIVTYPFLFLLNLTILYLINKIFTLNLDKFVVLVSAISPIIGIIHIPLLFSFYGVIGYLSNIIGFIILPLLALGIFYALKKLRKILYI